MKRLLIALAATAALALGACATATPYQPARPGSSTGGYSERQIEENRWAVTFSGNSLTDRRTVETYLLYRAAELTQQQGFDWFAIVDRNTDRETRLESTFYDPYYYGGWGLGGWWGPSWRFYGGPRYYGGGWGPWSSWGYWGRPSSFDYREVTRYEATAEIFLGKGPKAADDRRAFDAKEVTARLASSIVRPEEKK